MNSGNSISLVSKISFHGRAQNLFVLLILCVLAATVLSGCINRQTAEITKGSDLNQLKSFYVLDHGRDKFRVSTAIRDRLNSMGFKAIMGTNAKPPQKVDAIVTYVDRWRWDITMYMLELTITIADTDSGVRFASGNSLHTSLTRKSKEEMVEEVL